MSIHDDNPDKQYIENLIAQLDESMSTEDTTKSNIPDAGKFSVTINVVISAETRSDRSEDDYIMIYVKAAQGRPMPIAIQKILLKDFSGEVKLSDKDSVMPTKMLSEAEKVVVVVRISASGSAVMQEGDVHVQSDIVDVKSNPVVNIKI
jgi:cytochrome c-type biogenesis protein CcmH